MQLPYSKILNDALSRGGYPTLVGSRCARSHGQCSSLYALDRTGEEHLHVQLDGVHAADGVAQMRQRVAGGVQPTERRQLRDLLKAQQRP